MTTSQCKIFIAMTLHFIFIFGASPVQANKDRSFAGINIGATELLDLVDDSTTPPSKQDYGKTIKYFFGYNVFTNMPLSLGYLDMGTTEIKTTILNYSEPLITKTDIKGVTLDIGYEFPIASKFSITAGVGAFTWKAEVITETPNFVGGLFSSYSKDIAKLKDTSDSSYLRFKYLPDEQTGWTLTLERVAVGGLDSNVATIGYFENY